MSWSVGKGKTGPGVDLWNLKAHSQGHTISSKATFLILLVLSTVPLPAKYVFKYMNLWEPFLFKAPHYPHQSPPFISEPSSSFVNVLYWSVFLPGTYSQHTEQPFLSTFTTIHCQEAPLIKAGVVSVYGYKHNCLEGSLVPWQVN